jgi:hypothetical protein
MDDFETKQQIQMVSAKKGLEQKVMNEEIATYYNDTLSSFFFASLRVKTSTITPSLSYFVYDKKLLRVYLTGGLPLYINTYSSENQDILHPSGYQEKDVIYKQYLYDYTMIEKLVFNYRAGIGVHFYNFFVEGFYQDNVSSLNDSGFYKSFPRMQVMVGVNLLSKKYYKNEFKKNVLPRENDSY